MEQAVTQTQAQTETEKKLPWIYLALYALVFVSGFLLRWLDLDAKPVHHDESLHLMYGRYFFDWPDYHYYKYSAMLHGPLLYNVLRFVYTTLGSSTWAGRSLVCLLGTLLMFSPLLFRKYFTRNTLLGLCTAVALSPTLIYWSRFIREDNLQLAAMMIMLCGIVLVRDNLKVIVALLGVTLQFCEKENSYVTMALLAGYIIFEACFNKVVFKSSQSMLTSLFQYFKKYWKETLVGLAFGAMIYVYLYSAGFRYWKGVTDGLYRESIIYWMNQHNIERISGPFLFHFYVLSWYELLFVLAALVQMGLFYWNAKRPIQIAGAVVLGIALFAGLTAGPEIKDLFPWSMFRLKEPLGLEVFGAIIITLHPLLLTIEHLWRKQQALAFWGYFFSASMFTYSYLGEKVPWLTVYPFVAGLVYLALYFQDYFSKKPKEVITQFPWWKVLRLAGVVLCALGLIFVVQDGGVTREREFDNSIILGLGIIITLFSGVEYFLQICGKVNLCVLAFVVLFVFNLRAAGLTNFVYSGKASEFMSQVHTTDEFHNFIQKLRSDILTPMSGVAPKVLGIEDSVWPVTWYMVDVPQYKFDAPENERGNFDYIIKNWKENEPAPAGFRAQRLNLRGWWVPDYQKMNLKKFLIYSLNHQPWSDTGFSYVTLLVKEKSFPVAAPTP